MNQSTQSAQPTDLEDAIRVATNNPSKLTKDQIYLLNYNDYELCAECGKLLTEENRSEESAWLCLACDN